MSQRLNRNLGDEDALQPGEYVAIEHEHVTRTMIKIVVCCPLCGGKRTLDERHAVAPDGKVTPALACSSCPLIEWIELGGWGEVSR